MDLVLNNPFRILGLPITSSSRDIAKRISDLEVFAELGREVSYESDFSELGDIDRSVGAVKDAAQKIELPESRLFHSLFWFRPGDTVDELALECVRNFELFEADAIWEKQIEKDGIGKASWRLNRFVFSLFMVGDGIDGVDKKFSTAFFNQALEDIGYVTDEFYEEVCSVVLGTASIDPRRLRELVIDTLLGIATKRPDNPYGSGAISLPEHCWSFDPEAVEYINVRVSNPLVNQIQDAIGKSKSIRDAGSTVDDLRRKNGLTKVEPVIYELQESLGKDNHRFQAIANSFADEVIACAVNAINRHESAEVAIMLADWADEIPSFGQTKEWINKQKKAIYTWDPNYVEDPPEDESEEEEEKEEEEEGRSPREPENRYPNGIVTCPACAKKFGPKDVKEFHSLGYRCPYCRQAVM